MSVIVKGMRMPDTCEECQVSCEVGSDLYCQVTDEGNEWGWKKSENGFEARPDWCPLVELPEKHGPMIDRNELEKAVLKWLPPDPCGREEKEYPFETDICVSMMMEIEEQETIVEAEGDCDG